jgi:hypothetical protein
MANLWFEPESIEPLSETAVLPLDDPRQVGSRDSNPDTRFIKVRRKGRNSRSYLLATSGDVVLLHKSFNLFLG